MYICNLMYTSFAAGVFCILYYLLCTGCCEFYVIVLALALILDKLEINSNMNGA
jgi:hypothetical protein